MRSSSLARAAPPPGTWTAFPDSRVEELIQADGLAEFIRLDLNADYRPDVVADVSSLPFRSGSIDRVASNSLIEHVAYPHRIIEETFRVLRPGGVMVVVMPFVWMLHGYPDDYVRLTPRFFERICRQVGFETSPAKSSPRAACTTCCTIRRRWGKSLTTATTPRRCVSCTS